MRRPLVLAALGLAFACGCKKHGARPADESSEPASIPEGVAPASSAPPAPPPRCRPDGAELPVLGEDVMVGEGVAVNDAVFVGLIRRVDGKRVASVLRAPRALDTRTIVDLGPALETDRAPVPYVVRGKVWVAFFARRGDDRKLPAREEVGTGPKTTPLAYAPGATRELRLVRVDDALALAHEGAVVQGVDESEAFDVAWPEPEGEPPLVAWDEDAPHAPGRLLADRGVVVVQRLRAGDKPRVVSPSTTDAEAPRLLRKDKGYWIAWLAKKPDVADAGAPTPDVARALETPGEGRVVRWVEIASLDAQGNLASPVHVVSSPEGHASAFELVPSSSLDAVTVLVADEAEDLGEGGGRIARYVVAGGTVSPAQRVAAGISSAPFSLVPTDAPGKPWLAWTDTAERTHGLRFDLDAKVDPTLAPAFASDAGASGTLPPTLEPALDGARLLASLPPDVFFAITDAHASSPSPSSPSPSQASATARATAIVRLVCR